MPLGNLNYLAITVAALTAFVLGAVWYSPLLFANAWVRASEHTPDKLASMQKGMVGRYAITLLAFFVMALVVAEISAIFGIVRVQGGLKLGLMLWVGFAVTLGLINTLYNARRMAVFFIDAGYALLYLLVMGTIIAVWR